MTPDRPVPDTPARSTPTIVAFNSPTNGIGRTGVVANLAWVLAASGARVAVADWCVEAPHVHDYLKPFHVRDLSAREFLDEVIVAGSRRTRAAEGALPPMEVRRYELPHTRARIDVVISRDPATPVLGFAPALEGLGEVQMLRESIRAAAYDYVLIDAPTNMSPDAAIRMARLADVVAVCFLPKQSSITAAEQIARTVWDATTTSTRIVAVPLQVVDDESDQASRGRRAIEDAFGSMLSGSAPTGGRALSAAMATIPYHGYRTFEEILAVLVDERADHRRAYWRLGGAITGADLGEPRELPAAVLAGYRRTVGLGTGSVSAEVVVAAAPADRPWTDWITAQLRAAGTRVSRDTDPLPPDASLVVVHSNEFTRSAAARRLLSTDGAPHLVVVSITDAPVPESLAKGLHVDLAGVTEDAEARNRLLAAFSLATTMADGGVRYPGRTNAWPVNLPRTSAPFVGRESQLEAMRDHFTTGTGDPGAWWVSGAPGIGKSELARTFAHRFAFDYQYVWWINAQDRRTITEDIAALAKALRLDASGDVTGKVFDQIAASPAGQRWLLVYDNADEDVPPDLRPRGGSAHVVITSRRPRPSDGVVLDRFEPTESVALLRDYVGDLVGDEAQQVADLVEHLPLTLNLTGAWLRETARRMRREKSTREAAATWAATEFRIRFGQQAGGRPESIVPDSLARAMQVLVASLRTEPLGEAVVRIAQLCMFLSSEGVALRLLRSVSVHTTLADIVETTSHDDLELDRILWFGARTGLFELRWSHPASVATHRLVQTLMRESTPAGERDERQATVLGALGGFAPSESEIDNGQRLEDLRELRKHIVVSGAPGSTDVAVRRWLVNQMRFFSNEGGAEGLRFAITVANEVLVNWAPDDQPDLRMQLRFHIANLYRALGDTSEALRLDQALLDDQMRHLGRDHPRTLRTARGVAHGMRVLGRFEDALAEDGATVRRFRNALGDDHPDTLRATNNLAFSLFLTGDTGKALAVQTEIRDRRHALLGNRHPDVWWSASTAGRYMCELGRYADALVELKGAFDRVMAMKSGNPRHELRIQWQWAIALRRSGKTSQARDKMADTVQRYRILFGENHADTQACVLTYAADHHATGESGKSVELARGSLDWFAENLGEQHPFTLLCRMDLAVFLRGDGQQEAALREGLAARDDLRRVLGRVHPWPLAAAVNQAVTLGRSDGADAAVHDLREIYEDCLEFLGADHPTTSTVSANLSTGAAEWKDVVLDVPDM